MKIIKKYWGLGIVFLLSLFTVNSFFVPGFFPMHDDTQVARVFEMGKMLKLGAFPVRWVSDLGYGFGYPIFNFYAPLAYYVGGFLNVSGLDALLATKLMMTIGILFSGVSMYVLAREFFKELGGVLAGLFYVYAPYHAVDIYVRGDVGEVWAYAFIPLVFYGLWKIHKEQKWKYVVACSFGYAGIILSHNLTAFMITPFLFIIILFQFYDNYKRNKPYSTGYTLYAIFLGLLVSIFYWLPALLEMKYTNVLSQIGGGADFRDHFVCLNQLWDSPWGFGGSTPGCIDGMSFKIGKLHITVVVFSFMLLVLKFLRKKFNHYNDTYYYIVKLIGFLILGFMLSIFFMVEISKPVWETISLMAFFQYPWRFLLLASFFSSFLAGGLIWSLEPVLKKKNYLLLSLAGPMVFLLLIFNVKLFQPQAILDKSVSDFTSDYAILWVASKTSDEYLPIDVKPPLLSSDIPKKNTDGKSIVVTIENHRELFGNYKNNLPPLRFEETNIEKVSNVLSLIGVVILIIGIIYEGKKLVTKGKR